MKKNMNKIFSVVLIVCMMFQMVSVFPLTSEAATTSSDVIYEEYSDISQYRMNGNMTAPEKEGYVFGGWFTAASDAKAVEPETISGRAYAKFVPEETLTVKAQITKKMLDNPSEVKFRLVTSVDSLKYQKVGFTVTINNKAKDVEITEVFEKIVVSDPENGTSIENPKTTFCDVANYFATVKIAGIKSEKFETMEINATPWWLTKDGTRVEGTGRNRMLVSDERTNDSDGSMTEEVTDFTTSDKTSYTYKTGASGDTASYQYFKGGSDTVYLSGKYTTTGTADNVFGITIRNGGQTRQVYFNGMGVKVLANTSKTDSGLADTTKAADYYSAIKNEDGAFVWSQTGTGTYPPGNNFKANSSTVSAMLDDTMQEMHDVVWAIDKNTLYCSVDGAVVLRIPMEKLCADWKQDRCYQLGIASYNNNATENALKIDVNQLAFGEDAEALLQPETESMTATNMAYEPITGSYMAATQTNAGYAYGTAVDADTPIAMETDLQWQDLTISGGRAGISVKLGEATRQIFITLTAISDGSYTIRKLHGHTWNSDSAVSGFEASAPAFDSEKNCNIKAAIYDDKLSVLFNDAAAYECTLASLFGTDYSETAKISLGVATWDSAYGQAQFKNVAFLEDQEAIALKTENWMFHSTGTQGTVSVNTQPNSGTASSTSATGWKKLYLSGTSDVWEITGTMSHGSGEKANLQGFKVWKEGQAEGATPNALILGENKGVTRVPNGNWTDCSKYAASNNAYSFQPLDGYFNSLNAATVDFKAMIVDDVFFMWLDGKLSWMLPLEETQFGGFEEGGKYQFALMFGEHAMAQSFSNVRVKTGSEVDATLVKTLKSCQHFDWLSANTMKTLSTDGRVVTIDNTTAGSKHVLSKTSGETVWLSGTWKDVKKHSSGYTFMYGVTIQDETGINRQVRFNGEGLSVMTDNKYWSDTTVMGNNMDLYKFPSLSEDCYVWPQRYVSSSNYNSQLRKMIMNTSGETDKITWAIQDNTLYCNINGYTCVILPLDKIYSGWTADSTHQYQIGFSQWDTNANGDVEVSDLELLYGTDAEKKLNENMIEASISENTRMVYDAIEGSYMPRLVTGFAGMYGPAAKSASVEADLSWADATDSSAGISVKQGDKSVELYIYSGNGNVYLMKNRGWTSATDRNFTEMQGVAKCDSNGVCSIDALVYKNKLYVSYNGVETIELDLATYIDGYVADEEVKIGLVTWGANGGLPIFKNIKWLSDEEALPIYIGSTSGTLEYDEREASITRTEANTATAYFKGSSQTWEVTGTMEQTDLSKLILQGFVVKGRTNGNRNHWTKDAEENWTATQWEELETRFYGQHDGFVTVGVRKDNADAASSDWNFSYNLTTNPAGTAGSPAYYVLNGNADKFFFAPATGQTRTNKTVDFRLVIAEDTLYLWLDDVLSWRIPLSVYTFGSYEAGSAYQLGVAFNNESGSAGFKNLVVKYGDGADTSGITNFAIKSSTGNASVCDPIEGVIERNQTSILRYYFVGTEEDAKSTKWEITGTMHRNNVKENVLMGFMLRSVNSNGATKEIKFYGTNQGFVEDWKWNNTAYSSPTATGGGAGDAKNYVFNPSIDRFFGSNKTVQDIDFRAVLVDDIFYVYFDDVLSWKIPLVQFCNGIDSNAQIVKGAAYEFGIVCNKDDVGTVSFRNLKVKSGNQVITADDTFIRDTYILAEDDTYYLYGSRFAGSVDVFTSRDLVIWEKHAPVYVPEEASWMAGKELWAPEVHAYTYNGVTNYYMFTSVSGTYGAKEIQRGTVILRADLPYGPFEEWSEGPVTPAEWKCLDGTLYVEDGTPYMIFSREYTDETLENILGVKTYNGEMYYMPLTQNLKAANGSAVKMFDAKTAANLASGFSGYVTDGPQIHKASDGNLFLLWSTFADGNGSTSNNRYIQMQLRSSNGKLVGAEWTYNAALPLLYGDGTEDGGHGMIFTDFSGNLKLILHTPNFYNVEKQRTERMKILDITYDTSNDCLVSE